MASYSGDMKPEDIVERAKDCYKLVCETESKQREREKADLEFQVAENQWDERAKMERAGGFSDQGVPLPPRPMLSIDQLKHPIQLVYNAFVKSKLGVLLKPVSAGATRKLAEAKQGLYRRIERDSNATQARAWALNRAIKCGRGAYRIVTRYDEDGEDPFDQEIGIERILYQENVYWDPAAEKPDLSDAKWLLHTGWKDAEDFAREFPGKIPDSTDRFGWGQFQESTPEWVRIEADGKRAVLVCQYWWKDIQSKEIKGPNGLKRTSEKTTIYCVRMNGQELLEEVYRWPGRYLPYVPVFGEELIPVDGDRRWQGMIRPARDAQQAFNYGFTTLVERAAKEPKTPYMVDPRQIEGYEQQWAQANTRDFAWLPYKATLEGQVVPPPARAQLDATGLSIAQIVIGTAKDGVQSATAIFDPGLGALPERRDAQSGRAIVALQQQGEAGTGQFTSSMADVSIRYEALAVTDLMQYIYDRPGRITSILTGEDDDKAVMIGAPFVRNDDGQPVPANPNDPNAEMIDLSKGKYNLVISVGKSQQSSLEAGQQFLGEVISGAPESMALIGDLVFKYREEPGSREVSERFEKEIRQTKPYLFDKEEGGLEQTKAKLAAAEANLAQLTEQAKMMDEALKTKQAEQQAKIQVAQLEAQLKMQLAELQAGIDREKAQMDHAAAIQKAEMDNSAKITVAKIQAEQKVFDAALKAEQEEKATGIEATARMMETEGQQEHESEMAERAEHHEAEMGMMDSEPERPSGGAE
jgi:hypothetical protein